MQGGYAAWQAAGLPTRFTALDYETNPREAVLDSAETAQSTARSVVRSLRWAASYSWAAALGLRGLSQPGAGWAGLHCSVLQMCAFQWGSVNCGWACAGCHLACSGSVGCLESIPGCSAAAATACSDPVNIYFGALAAAGGVSFVRDWHATLQTVGLWGLLLSTGNWARKTEDPGVGPPRS